MCQVTETMGACQFTRGRSTGASDDDYPYIPSERTLLNELQDLSLVDKKAALKRLLGSMKPDRHGFTPLHHAAESGRAGQCRALASLTDVIDLCEGPTGTTPLILAASNGHTECVEVLLDAGADVNAVDRWCNTALFKASCYNFTDCVMLLLQRQADPNLPNQWGSLPLQYAAKQGYADVVRMLIDFGADVNLHIETSSYFALTAAASLFHADIVDILLQNGADINYRPKSTYQYGQTALCVAVTSPLDAYTHYAITTAMKPRQMRCIQSLIKAGGYTGDCLEKLPLKHDELTQLVLRDLPFVGQEQQTALALAFKKWFKRDLDVNREQDMFTIKLLHLTGFDFFSFCLANENELKEHDVRDALQPFTSQPRSLQNICQLAIRKTLRPNVQCSLDKLPLPKFIQTNLHDLCSIHL